MIQRVQSLYLFGAALLHIILFFLPIYWADVNPNTFAHLNVLGLELSSGGDSISHITNAITMLLAAVNALIIVLAMADIFMFRNRKRQLLVSRFTALLAIIFIALAFYATEMAKTALAEQAAGAAIASSYKLGMWLPIVSLIFMILAGRGIMKDEKLVRSADRLR